MRGAATSDLHLGHRRYPATEGGRNVRELDVERAWDRAVEHVIHARPDLVTMAGDIFDTPRPSYAAALAYLRGVRRLSEETEAHVVVLLGNHCAVRTAGAVSPDLLAGDLPRVHVAVRPERIRFEAASTGESVAVACFPFVAGTDDRYRLEPAPDADVNVLCLHGAVKGGESGDAMPWFYSEGRALDIGREAEAWDVIACGDFHDFRRLHGGRLAFYSGAIETVSSNPWEEAEDKGIVVYDTETGDLAFRSHPTRRVADFSPSDLARPDLGWDPVALVDACVRALSSEVDGLDGSVVRLRVPDFPRERRGEVDQALIRKLRERSLHFQLDFDWLEREIALGDRSQGTARHTMEQEARAFFEDDAPAVRRLALQYLGLEADEEASPRHQGEPAEVAGGPSPADEPLVAAGGAP